ncbi:peptidoglycan recognition protein family protein [Nocardia sp. Marseille-Q1738]
MGNQLEADVTILSPSDGGPRDPHSCSLIIVHTNEGPADGSLEGLLNYLAQPEVGASYTIVVGADGRIGRSNDDDYIPWAAGSPANERGLHLCFLGYARQPRDEWLSRPAQLDAGARVLRDWSDRYGIPLVKLNGDQMRAGESGVGGHGDTVEAWHATDHSDPGEGFPWDVLLAKAMESTPATT